MTDYSLTGSATLKSLLSGYLLYNVVTEDGLIRPSSPFIGDGGAAIWANLQKLQKQCLKWFQANPTPSLSVPANGEIIVTHPEVVDGKIQPIAKINNLVYSYKRSGVKAPLPWTKCLGASVVLQSGKILFAGGDHSGVASVTCALYDPVDGSWITTGSLNVARDYHNLILLPSGKVLAVCGYASGANNSCEIYDPTAGTWSTAASTAHPHMLPASILLNSGKVLVVSGSSGYDDVYCELYTPGTDSWADTGSIYLPLFYHTLTLLDSGKVLLAGGMRSYAPDYAESACQIYDPTAGTWSSTASMSSVRERHSAIKLSNGKVLITGGVTDGAILNSCEIFDPAGNGGVGTWSAAASMTVIRYWHSSLRLSNGKVIVLGGINVFPANGYTATCELYDPIYDVWSTVPSLTYSRAEQCSELLGDFVFVMGGHDISVELLSCEMVDMRATPQYNPCTIGNYLCALAVDVKVKHLSSTKTVFKNNTGYQNDFVFETAQ